MLELSLDLPSQADGFAFRHLYSNENKLFQAGFSFLTKENEKIDMLAFQVDDEKMRLGFPDVVDFVMSISSKNFGKEASESCFFTILSFFIKKNSSKRS